MIGNDVPWKDSHLAVIWFLYCAIHGGYRLYILVLNVLPWLRIELTTSPSIINFNFSLDERSWYTVNADDLASILK